MKSIVAYSRLHAFRVTRQTGSALEGARMSLAIRGVVNHWSLKQDRRLP